MSSARPQFVLALIVASITAVWNLSRGLALAEAGAQAATTAQAREADDLRHRMAALEASRCRCDRGDG
jgi:hypothetical protein